MFKKAGLLIILSCVLICSCKKTTSDPPVYDADYGDLIYSIEGIHDTTVEQSGDVTVNLFVKRSAGKFEDLNLSVSDMPNGISAYFTPSVGTPSFNSVLTLETKRAAVGTYHIGIVGVSKTSGLRNFDLMLTVTPYSDPALALEGTFKEDRSCSQSGGSANNVTVQAVTGATHKMKITGIWSSGNAYTVIADANPVGKVITIAPQVINGLTFAGSGNYSDNDNMTITYAVTGNLVNDNCTSTFVRQ